MDDQKHHASGGIQIVVLERVEVRKNISRFYVLTIDQTLFGDASFTRSWGRIGSRGREHRCFFANQTMAREALEDWLHRKRGRGYRIASTLDLPSKA